MDYVQCDIRVGLYFLKAHRIAAVSSHTAKPAAKCKEGNSVVANAKPSKMEQYMFYNRSILNLSEFCVQLLICVLH